MLGRVRGCERRGEPGGQAAHPGKNGGVLVLSEVFRDAQSFEGTSKSDGIKHAVTLLDPDFETASAFEKVLDVAWSGAFHPSAEAKDLAANYRNISSLLKFARKWECVAVHDAVQQSLVLARSVVKEARLIYFAIYPSLDSHDPSPHNLVHCVLALRKEHSLSAVTRPQVQDERIFDPRFYPAWVGEDTPLPYIAALVQAWKAHADARQRGFRLATKFERYLAKCAWGRWTTCGWSSIQSLATVTQPGGQSVRPPWMQAPV